MKRTLLTITLSVAGLSLLFALNAQMRRTAAAELALTEGTLAAVAEASAELEQLTLSMEKLLISSPQGQRTALLSQIVLSADRISRCLSDLPDTQGQHAAVMTFLTDLTTHAQTLLTSSDDLSAQDRSYLNNSLNGVRMLQAEISLARQDLLTGADLDAALPSSEVTAPPSAQELAGYKALPSETIGLGRALQIAKEFVGMERVTSVTHAPDTTGAMPAYGVTVQTPGLQLNLEITRQGGKVLMMMPETANFPLVRSVQECTSAALAFLQTRGFPRMEAPFYQVYNGLCVLTCVYVEQGVLVWPDRVLVQVRMDTGEVVGIEARRFWQNHTPRRFAVPLLSETEARASLSPDATVHQTRQCLIRSGQQERLCWQFTLQYGDEIYLSCIDAITGAELLLEKIVQLESGNMPA